MNDKDEIEVTAKTTWRVWWDVDRVRFKHPRTRGTWSNQRGKEVYESYCDMVGGINYTIPPEVRARIKELHEENRPLAENEFFNSRKERLTMRVHSGVFQSFSCGSWWGFSEDDLGKQILFDNSPNSWPRALAYFKKHSVLKVGDKRVWIDDDHDRHEITMEDGHIHMWPSSKAGFNATPEQARGIAQHLIDCANEIQRKS